MIRLKTKPKRARIDLLAEWLADTFVVPAGPSRGEPLHLLDFQQAFLADHLEDDVTAQDSGAPVYDAAGELQYDKADDTLGYVDKSKETVLTFGPSYLGSHLVTVLSEVAPNGAALILIDGVFYSIVSVHSANILATMITYDCNALGPSDAPVIRNA